MPPPSRDSAVPDPASRGSRYFELRQLDLPLPACRRAARDVEDQLRAIHDLAVERVGEMAQLQPVSARCREITTSTSASAHGGEALHLPRPMNVAGSGRGPARCPSAPPWLRPASASPSSSASEHTSVSARRRSGHHANKRGALDSGR
jgi:hypothetical protein